MSHREAVVGGEAVRAYAAAPAAWEAEVVVGVALHDQAGSLPESLASIAAQRCPWRVGVLVLDDGSADDWAHAAAPWLAGPGVVVASSRCGSAAKARNRLLDLADALFPAARWVARLDADDRFSTPASLASACALADRSGAVYVLGGNRLRAGGALLPRANPATDLLLDPTHVMGVLEAMAGGTAENELPSCNLLLAARGGLRYPETASAEDHWLVAGLLLNRPRQGAILTAPFYCDYTLDGGATAGARRSDEYLRSRRALYRAARTWAESGQMRESACC